MIMEYCDHGTLHDVIHSTQQQQSDMLTRDVIWHYVVQIFSALYYLHEQRIVHRDIKPLNVFLSGPDGRIVKLGTFFF
jgi:translation initiation factor 2-alpha kinase 4